MRSFTRPISRIATAAPCWWRRCSACTVPDQALRRRWIPGTTLAEAVKQAMDQLDVEIVKRSEAHRFVVLPKRWLVERTIAGLNRCRRLAKD